MTSSGAARVRCVADRPKAVADTAPGCEPAHPKGPVHWAATGVRLVGYVPGGTRLLQWVGYGTCLVGRTGCDAGWLWCVVTTPPRPHRA